MRLLSFSCVSRATRPGAPFSQILFPALLAVPGSAPRPRLRLPPGSAPTNAPIGWMCTWFCRGDPASVSRAGGAGSRGAAGRGRAAQTKLRLAELSAQHSALQPQIEAAGGLVRTHYTRLLNAIKVRVSSDKVPALAAPRLSPGASSRSVNSSPP